MKTDSRVLAVFVFFVSASLLIPADVLAQAAQRAGQVSRTIPAVEIARGSQQLAAAPKLPVDWGDIVNTDPAGRARIALDDGSLINVGASSSFAVTQHNPAAQQTQIELTYGRMRSQVVKQTKPNAKFEVHTPVGVAGVVGTDFYLSYLNGLFQVIVFDGHVRFCNLDGMCVDVLAGQIATIRNGHQSPDQPTQATPSELAEAVNATSIGAGLGGPPPHPVNPWVVVVLTLAVAVPAIAIPLATRGKPPGQVIPIKGCGQFGVAC